MNEQYDIVILLKNKKLSGLGYGTLVCEWCKVSTTVLHKHHYPISKKFGGDEVVRICPNCHNEFHHPDILKSKTIHAKVDDRFYSDFSLQVEYSGLNESEFIRSTLQKEIDRLKNEQLQKEIMEW
jgi:hypothetical protein